MDNTKKQRIISLCSGYGGIELGLRLAGLNFRTVCYVEIEAFAQANLVAKIEEGKMDAAPIWSDLKTFSSQQFSGKIHGIIGGYPCQPFSVAGKQLGSKDPRHLWPYIREHIRTIKPVWCFFENVRGHVKNGLREVKQDLESMGYSAYAGIFSAEEVGACHKRERLFIMANSNGERRAKQAITCGFYETFPMPPGSSQFTWEKPRTIKPRLGRTTDGPSSRVDRLRLLGNGVVPQTAAKAWIHLIQKINL